MIDSLATCLKFDIIRVSIRSEIYSVGIMIIFKINHVLIQKGKNLIIILLMIFFFKNVVS